jgi:hypothetical protein
MKRFAAAEATMEQRAQEQQFELLMLAADKVTPWLFDVATRAEIGARQMIAGDLSHRPSPPAF